MNNANRRYVLPHLVKFHRMGLSQLRITVCTGNMINPTGSRNDYSMAEKMEA